MVSTVNTFSIQDEVDNLIFRYIRNGSSNAFLKYYLSQACVTIDTYGEDIWIDFPPFDAEGHPHYPNREAYSQFRRAWDSVAESEQVKIFPARFDGYRIFLRAGDKSIKIRSGYHLCSDCSVH